MAVKTDSPQVAALIIAVEHRKGKHIESRSDFSNLVSDIERVTGEHLGENTLRRIWGKLEGYNTVFKRTLDVLCRYCGFEHFDTFCDNLKSEAKIESQIVKDSISIRVEDLQVGDRIRIGWMPDRVCIVEYEGCRTFKAIDAVNSTLQVGDTFECSMMLKHYPLFVDNLVHGGELCTRYSMGLDNGLTTLEKI